MGNELIIKAKNWIEPKLPDILMAVCSTGVVSGTVMACFATTKLPEIMEDYHLMVDYINTHWEDDDPEKKKELAHAKRELVWNLTKNFGPAAAVEILSLVGMFAGYSKVKAVSAELAAACAGYETMIKGYRARVEGEVGTETENRLWLGGENKTITTTKTMEDGTVVTEETTVPVFNSDLPSIYARWFCFGEATGAEPDLDYNERFLRAQERLWNVYLDCRKVIFLNDVLRSCGLKESLAGNRVGWVLDPKKPLGDQLIDLRIQKRLRDYGNGDYRWELLIDPNVMGVIDELAVSKGLLLEY